MYSFIFCYTAVTQMSDGSISSELPWVIVEDHYWRLDLSDATVSSSGWEADHDNNQTRVTAS